MPEARVQQMQCGMLHTAIVPVDRQPVLELIWIRNALVIVRIDVAQEVPAGTSPLRHRVGLATRRTSAMRACGVDPVVYYAERTLAGIDGFVMLDLGSRTGN